MSIKKPSYVKRLVDNAANYATDPSGRFEHVQKLTAEVLSEAAGLLEQIRRVEDTDKVFLEKSHEDFEVVLDAAFEHLVEVTGQVLTLSNGETRIRRTDPQLLPLLGQTDTIFGKLSGVANGIVGEFGKESVNCKQYQGVTDAFQQEMDAFMEALRVERSGVNDYATRLYAEAIEIKHDLDNETQNLQNVRNDRSFLDDWFGNSTNDWQQKNYQNNIDSYKQKLEAKNNSYGVMSKLRETYDSYGGDLRNTKQEMSRMADRAKAEYAKLVGLRAVADKTRANISLLAFHIESSEYTTTRDSCLRHILDLTHTILEDIDSDVHVRQAKEAIDAKIKEKLGVEKWAALEQEKTALEAEGFEV